VSIEATELQSPGWYFNRLALAMGVRNPQLEVLASYMDGNAPLPEGAHGMREAYQNFQRKARVNFGELVVEAAQERMSPSGFRIGDAKGLSQEALKIWSYNELDTFAGDIHADMLGLRDGYAIVGPPGADGIPIVTREDPLLMIVDPDPLRPSRARAALKLYRDATTGLDTAYLYLPGAVYVATRDNQHSVERLVPSIENFDWVPGMNPMYWPKDFADVVPVVCFHNKNGVGEFERHTDTLDRINWTILETLVIIAMQAYRQRVLSGSENYAEVELNAAGEPVLDSAGDPVMVDMTATMKPGAGNVWMVPEGVEFKELGTTDFQQVLAAVKDYIRDLAAATRTPMYALMPDGANQSAEGARAMSEQLIAKVRDRIKRASYGWNQVMALALRFQGVTANVTDIETLWLSPESISLAERADAASKLKAAGVPRKTIWTKVLGYSPEEAEEMEQEILAELLEASLGPQPPVPGSAPVTPNGV